MSSNGVFLYFANVCLLIAYVLLRFRHKNHLVRVLVATIMDEDVPTSCETLLFFVATKKAGNIPRPP